MILLNGRESEADACICIHTYICTRKCSSILRICLFHAKMFTNNNAHNSQTTQTKCILLPYTHLLNINQHTSHIQCTPTIKNIYCCTTLCISQVILARRGVIQKPHTIGTQYFCPPSSSSSSSSSASGTHVPHQSTMQTDMSPMEVDLDFVLLISWRIHRHTHTYTYMQANSVVQNLVATCAMLLLLFFFVLLFLRFCAQFKFNLMPCCRETR